MLVELCACLHCDVLDLPHVLVAVSICDLSCFVVVDAGGGKVDTGGKWVGPGGIAGLLEEPAAATIVGAHTPCVC